MDYKKFKKVEDSAGHVVGMVVVTVLIVYFGATLVNCWYQNWLNEKQVARNHKLHQDYNSYCDSFYAAQNIKRDSFYIAMNKELDLIHANYQAECDGMFVKLKKYGIQEREYNKCIRYIDSLLGSGVNDGQRDSLEQVRTRLQNGRHRLVKQESYLVQKYVFVSNWYDATRDSVLSMRWDVKTPMSFVDWVQSRQY